ncbi:uncharacterized protein KY384_002400 [Bacidia gigantensis]|uniref:uncharacterized protein n=1 Tax=Bacidia gigantensis TaxID=2732470 RepID=UPI001D03C74C|nr:uncharacterized protein KY384_002400 [Bacidia gigantensis]KAG8532523.1 hypothetical protein KY384_002400 [Bacidia gigantensis]
MQSRSLIILVSSLQVLCQAFAALQPLNTTTSNTNTTIITQCKLDSGSGGTSCQPLPGFVFKIPGSSISLVVSVEGDIMIRTDIESCLDTASDYARSQTDGEPIPIPAGYDHFDMFGAEVKIMRLDLDDKFTWQDAVDVFRGLKEIEIENDFLRSVRFQMWRSSRRGALRAMLGLGFLRNYPPLVPPPQMEIMNRTIPGYFEVDNITLAAATL